MRCREVAIGAAGVRVFTVLGDAGSSSCPSLGSKLAHLFCFLEGRTNLGKLNLLLNSLGKEEGVGRCFKILLGATTNIKVIFNLSIVASIMEVSFAFILTNFIIQLIASIAKIILLDLEIKILVFFWTKCLLVSLF